MDIFIENYENMKISNKHPCPFYLGVSPLLRFKGDKVGPSKMGLTLIFMAVLDRESIICRKKSQTTWVMKKLL